MTSVTAFVNVVDVNDNPPVFRPVSYRVEVDEGLEGGAEILALGATDKDAGNNGRIQYQILEGNSDGQFELNETTGVIYSSSSSSSSKLDRELREYYTLDILAVDQAPEPNRRLTATAQVVIVLRDVNGKFCVSVCVGAHVRACACASLSFSHFYFSYDFCLT